MRFHGHLMRFRRTASQANTASTIQPSFYVSLYNKIYYTLHAEWYTYTRRYD